jgi:hypothetical protein
MDHAKLLRLDINLLQILKHQINPVNPLPNIVNILNNSLKVTGSVVALRHVNPVILAIARRNV